VTKVSLIQTSTQTDRHQTSVKRKT